MFVQLEELRCMCTILEWIIIKSVGFLIQAQNLSMNKTNLESADGIGISVCKRQKLCDPLGPNRNLLRVLRP